LLADGRVLVAGGRDSDQGVGVASCEIFSLTPVAPPIDGDGDGLTDAAETAIWHTNPADPDTDDDGLLDGTEVDMAMGSGSPDPLVADSDGDGLLDGAEVALGTNPGAADSDGDGVLDGADPLPTIPGVTTGYLEERIRLLSLAMSAIDLARFDAPNQNAREGRRNSLANRVRNAANAVADGDRAGAITLLEGVLQRTDGATSPPDWLLASPEQQMLRAELELLLNLLHL
jgi:hypothetical protein